MDNENIFFLLPELFLNLKRVEVNEGHFLRGEHFHDAVEMVRVDEGEILCQVGKESLALKKGETVLINKRVLHQLSFHLRTAVVTYIQIEMDRYTEVFRSGMYLPMNYDGILKYKIFDADSEISGIFNDIITEIQNKASCYERYIKSDIFRISAIMARNKLVPTVELNDNTELNKLIPVFQYIDANIDKKIYIDEVSKLLNIDKFYFCKLFKQTTGLTFIDYLNLLRLRRAEEYLLGTSQNISEIAYSCGFASLQYFNRLFKAHHKLSPKEFRKLNISIYS